MGFEDGFSSSIIVLEEDYSLSFVDKVCSRSGCEKSICIIVKL
jgi:hypothetical protein